MTTHEEERSQSRKSCFGILVDLEDQLACEGLTDDHFWYYIKDHYGVNSRSDLGRVGWTQIATGLSMAKENPVIFERLVRKLWRYHWKLNVDQRRCALNL